MGLFSFLRKNQKEGGTRVGNFLRAFANRNSGELLGQDMGGDSYIKILFKNSTPAKDVHEIKEL